MGSLRGIEMSVGDRLVGRDEDVRFAGVPFALDARDDEVSGAHAMSLFQRVNPTMLVMAYSALLAETLPRHRRMSVVSND